MTLPYVLFALSTPFLITGIAARPSPQRWMFFLPLVSLCICIYSSGLVGDTLTAYLTIYVFTASDYLLLTDVQRELRLTSQRKSISEAPFLSRLKWSLELVATPRGIGWMHEPKYGIPPRSNLRRRPFILSCLVRILSNVVLVDVTKITIIKNPSFQRTAPPFAEQDVLWRSWCILQFLVVTVCCLNVMYLLLSVTCIVMGLSEPRDWPDLFGRFSDAYTVRRFWSRTWHQLLRRILSSHGKYVAERIFSLQPGTSVFSSVQLCIVFFLSGIIHTTSFRDSGPICFFLLQPMAIAFEGAVIKLEDRIGLHTQTVRFRYLGYVWVWCWFVYSTPPWWNSMIRAGIFDLDGSFVIAYWLTAVLGR